MTTAQSPTATVMPVAWEDMRGWLNLPPAHTPLREALVFLGAHGSEDLCSRHSLACLANDLSQAGHPVLRVDLPGTADALGDLLAPDLWSRWVAGAASAVQRLRAWSGAEHVGLLGLRLGALVAIHAAKQLHDAATPVHSLVLLAPVLQGKQHLRELRALSAPGDSLTVAGFTWGEPLQHALSLLDTAKDPGCPPVQRVFLGVAQTNKALLTVQQQWGQALPMHSEPYGDLVAHIGHTTNSQAPVALWQALGAWMAQGPAGKQPPSPPLRGTPSSTLTGPHGVEHGWALPYAVPLAAVLSVPNDFASHAPVVVLCNTGRNPHTGWARGWVKLARELAREGVASLRFDIAGVGDSPPLPDAPAELLYDHVSLPQMDEAITQLLTRLGPRPVVLVGNCTGGYLSFHQAKTDARVTHLLLANVQHFVWIPGMSLEVSLSTATKSSDTYARLLLQPTTWLRVLKGQVNIKLIATKFWRLARHAAQPAWDNARALTPGALRDGVQPANARQAVLQGFKNMAARGTRVSVVYSEGDGGRDEFATYFGASGRGFTRLAGTRLHQVPAADHEFTSAESQAALLQAIRQLYAA